MPPRHGLTVGGVVASFLLTACFTTTADFRRDAENYIRDDVAPQLDATFTSVSCVPPVDQEVGTRFACSALDDSGGVWEFDNVIDAPNEFTVTVSRRP